MAAATSAADCSVASVPPAAMHALRAAVKVEQAVPRDSVQLGLLASDIPIKCNQEGKGAVWI